MKKWIFLAAIVLAAVGYGGYRLYEYHEWKTAYGRALDALHRAYEYKEAGVLLYEPRRKDFEVADDQLQRLSQFSVEAQSDANILHYCGEELRMYRNEGADASDALASAEDSTGTLRKEFLDNSQQFLDLQRSLDKEIQHCLAAR
jgi:hypothetical protein